MGIFLEEQDASIRLKNLRIVERRNGPLQSVVLYRHKALGLVLTIDGELQHVEAWQALYHEPLIHLPASFVPTVQSVLILGGGDLFAAREALKYSSVSEVMLVEHDQNVIDLTKRYYGHAEGVLSDSRLTIKIADARTELLSRSRKFDLVVNDCFDLSALVSFESPYIALEARLTARGVCSDMIYRHVFEKKIVKRSLSKLSRCSRVVMSLMTIPEYPGALHLQTLWGRNKHLTQSSRTTTNRIQRRFLETKRGIQFDYYDPRYRSYFLYVPPYIASAIAT
jgi:spermidine synthase